MDSLSVSSDGHLAASADSECDDLVLWDLKAGRPEIQLTGNKEIIFSAAPQYHIPLEWVVASK